MANEIGKRIGFARRRLGVTQRKMAEDLAVGQSTIAAIEIGRLMPSLGSLYKYCAYLDIPLQFILNDQWPITEDGLEVSKMVSQLTQQDILRLKPHLDVYLRNKDSNYN